MTAVAVPTADAVEDALTQAGSNAAAAELLGINSRTFERMLTRHPDLWVATMEGREAHRAAQPLPDHGTTARYRLERIGGEATCTSCRAANASDHRKYCARRLAAKAGTR